MDVGQSIHRVNIGGRMLSKEEESAIVMRMLLREMKEKAAAHAGKIKRKTRGARVHGQ